jgi:hypothetical protein
MKRLRPSRIASMFNRGKTTLWGIEKRGDTPPGRLNTRANSGRPDDVYGYGTGSGMKYRHSRYNKSNI